MRSLIILTIFIAGRVSASVTNNVSERDKDVLILSILVQDHLRKTNGREINLADLLQADTLKRISKSFEKVELKSKGGHISVYYKFSESRDLNGIELLAKEKERTQYFRWAERNLKNQYDGEIRLDYGERFYRVIKLIRNTSS
jgi:hypothetical protein